MSLRVPYYNMTLNDIDINTSDMDFMDIYRLFVYGFAGLTILLALFICYANLNTKYIKDQIIIPNLKNWFKRPKKAKESPFISYQPATPLSDCYTLDGAEKGQNLVVKYRIPRHSFAVRENNQETNITITVQDSH
jgi:hypothetical protein